MRMSSPVRFVVGAIIVIAAAIGGRSRLKSVTNLFDRATHRIRR